MLKIKLGSLLEFSSFGKFGDNLTKSKKKQGKRSNKLNTSLWNQNLSSNKDIKKINGFKLAILLTNLII